MQLIDPESLRVLVDYRTSIESLVDPHELANERKNWSFALDDLQVKTTALDDVHTRVDVTSLRGQAKSIDSGVADSATFAVNGTCYNATDTIGRAKPEASTGCLKDTGYTFGLNSFFIVVSQRAGQYYLDPLRTIEEYARLITASKDFDALMCQASGKQCNT